MVLKLWIKTVSVLSELKGTRTTKPLLVSNDSSLDFDNTKSRTDSRLYKQQLKAFVGSHIYYFNLKGLLRIISMNSQSKQESCHQVRSLALSEFNNEVNIAVVLFKSTVSRSV